MCYLSNKSTVSLINKLVKEYEVVEFVEPWTSCVSMTSSYCCKLKPTKKLDAFCKGMLVSYIDSNAKLTLTRKPTGELLINDIFLECKTNENSINDRILRFLIENPNNVFRRADLKEKGILKAEKKEDKDFHIVLADIGMREDLKKVFFGKGLTKHSICLTNPVY